MSKKIEMVGQRFGRLIVIGEAATSNRERYWLCQCDCGNTKVIRGMNLRRQKTHSCGCIARETGAAKKLDLVGHRYGRLMVVAEADRGERYGVHWLCLCDCGSTTEVAATLLGRNTKSCGCLQREVSGDRLRGRIPANRRPIGDSAVTTVFANYRSSAKARGLEFALLKGECRLLMEQNCFYCGVEPQQLCRPNDYSSWLYNGLDRVDSSQGYLLDNVVPCCGTCNKAKLASSSGDFVLWVERTYLNLKKRGVIE